MKLTENTTNNTKDDSSDMPVNHYKKPMIWILVADSHIVRLFKKNGHGVKSFGEITPTPHEGKDFTNKTMGRGFSSCSGTIHHKYEPHMNESRRESLSFAHEISDWLDKSARENAFDRLVLVAAPQTLGELRKALSKHVHARVVAEVDKILTKLPESELQEELEKIVWF
ncbi:MAG: host attachment protein [Micavibrio aeruginosavorus]|uniref:Host attachment protein n=1 Tax=Micavibrio aeruginosavorus TaxID=349221 RepID=A0A7T5R1H6_9BACT|nr:MAG: host attachment protein [Micavibrio aeruginosavorus]